MTEGFIDSASAYEVILVLARQTPQNSYRGEWDLALEVTATLISANQIRIAPSVRPDGPASGAYGLLLEGLQSVLSRITLPDAATAIALKRTKRWASDHADTVRQKLRCVAPGGDSGYGSDIALWLDAHIAHEWEEHVLRHKALFDQDLNVPLARILNVSLSELGQVWIASSNKALIAEFVRKRPDSDLFKLMCDAFVGSTLLRGRFHDEAAREAGFQILSHTIRKPFLRKMGDEKSIFIDASNTERYLASIVMAGAFAEKDHHSRVKMWVDNVLTLRRIRDQINLDPKDRDETALNVAIDAAKKYDVRVHSRMLETYLDVSVGIGSAALTSFCLTPWEGFATSVAAAAASSRYKIGETLATTLIKTRGNLRSLSQMGPGRLGRK